MATYYVRTGGSDSHSAVQAQVDTDLTAWLTIQKGITNLVAGDTLIIHTGTYAESIDCDAYTIPSGNSSNRITIRAYTGETFTLAPSGDAGIKLNGQSYLTFKDFNITVGVDQVAISFYNHNGPGGTPAPAGDHCRFENIDMSQTHGGGVDVHASGVNLDAMANDNEFINCHVHDFAAHAYYCTGNRNIVDGGSIYHNGDYGTGAGVSPQHGEGFLVYGDPSNCSGNTVRNCTIYDNRNNGIHITNGDGNRAYNNIVYSNGGGDFGVVGGSHDIDANGIEISLGATNAQAYNNSIYANTAYGINASNNSSAKIRNNISHDNVLGDIYLFSSSSSGTISNNLTKVAITDETAGASNSLASNFTVTASPFTTPGSDFTLHAAPNPAIDAATDTAAISSIFTTDFLSSPRPAGAWDIGAYELGATPPVAGDGFFSKIYYKSLAASDGTTIMGPSVFNTAATAGNMVHYAAALYKVGATNYVSIYGRNGSEVTGSTSPDSSTTWVAGDAFSLEVTGTSTYTLVAKQNDTQIGSQSMTDSALSSNGAFGFILDGTDDAVIESWEAGIITAGVRTVTVSSSFGTGTGTLGSVANNDGWEQLNLAAATITYTNGAVTSSPRSSDGFNFAVARWVGISPPVDQTTRFLLYRLI